VFLFTTEEVGIPISRSPALILVKIQLASPPLITVPIGNPINALSARPKIMAKTLFYLAFFINLSAFT
jgi:hypothetical protein